MIQRRSILEPHLFRPRPRLRVRRRNCSLRQVRVQGARGGSKPCCQNFKSKSFRLIFGLKRLSCSLCLSACRNERDIPLLRERRRCLSGLIAGHSIPIDARLRQHACRALKNRRQRREMPFELPLCILLWLTVRRAQSCVPFRTTSRMLRPTRADTIPETNEELWPVRQ